MSEFNTNPSAADEYVKSYLARSASELDAIAALSENEKTAEDGAGVSAFKRARR
jgi:hypothetical protein